MIKEELKNTTVITIALRLNTIVYYDRILVLEQGVIMEFDTPKNLINNPQSDFYKIISKNGQQYFQNSNL